MAYIPGEVPMERARQLTFLLTQLTFLLTQLTFLLTLSFGAGVSAADWPHWRGPDGTGVSPEKNLPVRWSATENVAWKAPIGGLGVSTPIVVGNRAFVTSQIGSGARRQGPRLVQGADAAAAGERALGTRTGADAERGLSGPPRSAMSGVQGTPRVNDDGRVFFVVEAFDVDTGKRVWEHRMAAEGDLASVHDKHNLASPSPLSDGRLVFAWFGNGQIVALDMSGKSVWQRHLGNEIAPFDINWGHGSSPAIFNDLLILLCDHTPASYLLALDTKTGKERWKVDRGKGRASYSTPFVVRAKSGPELIVNSTERIDAYDPATGAFLWHAAETSRFAVPMPTAHDGVLYASRGYRSGPYMAIRPGGRGDVRATHVVWNVATGAPYISSLLYAAGLLYMANDVGIVTAVDASTGERVWQERLGGVYSASPVAADGKVYLVSEAGETIVLRAGPKPEVLARNDIGERSLASPVISQGRIFIRTDDHLFCIRKP